MLWNNNNNSFIIEYFKWFKLFLLLSLIYIVSTLKCTSILSTFIKTQWFFFTDFVAVPVKIFVNGSVQVASSEYKFYNCAAAVRKAENTPYVSSLASFVSVCVPVLCWHQYVYNEYEYL